MVMVMEISMSHTTIGVVACVFLVLAILVYRALLPKPIPGIPYHKVSANRILGDVPDVMAWKNETGEIWSYIRKLAVELDSPVIQMFMRPYAKPWVIVTDFRESLDIQISRSSEFDRGGFLGDIFKPLLPGNHVWMPTGDRFRANRQLIRDTMSPAFLNQVAAPQIHASTQGMLELWRQRARLAKGRPFEAEEDIFRATVDVILAATFNFEVGAVKAQAKLLSELNSMALPPSINTPVVFPAVEDPEDFRAIRTLTNSVEIALNSPLPRISLGFALRFYPSLIAANKYKARMLGERLKLAWNKFSADADQDDKVKCAVDLVVQREAQMAKKEKREIKYDTLEIRDELFGFLQAGHETGSTTLCWAMKYLTVYQEAQKKVRADLRSVHKRAAEAGDLPTAQEIAKASVPYLDAFIEETHRCGTTSSAVVRVTIKDAVILGHEVPKGSDIFMLMCGPGFQVKPLPVDELLRSSTSREMKNKYGVWDPSNIEKFVPERWLVEDEKGGYRFNAYAGPANPYGAGLRGCFGTKLAALELKIIITLVVWSFELQETPPSLSGLEGNDKNTHRPQHVYLRPAEIKVSGEK